MLFQLFDRKALSCESYTILGRGRFRFRWPHIIASTRIASASSLWFFYLTWYCCFTWQARAGSYICKSWLFFLLFFIVRPLWLRWLVGYNSTICMASQGERRCAMINSWWRLRLYIVSTLAHESQSHFLLRSVYRAFWFIQYMHMMIIGGYKIRNDRSDAILVWDLNFVVCRGPSHGLLFVWNYFIFAILVHVESCWKFLFRAIWERLLLGHYLLQIAIHHLCLLTTLRRLFTVKLI